MLRFACALALLSGPLHADGYSVGDTFEDPMVIAAEAFAGFPPDEEGRPVVEVSARTNFYGYMTILVAHTGFADDSVAGQREEYVLTEADGMWELVIHRTHYMCRRGLNTVTWQLDLCP